MRPVCRNKVSSLYSERRQRVLLVEKRSSTKVLSYVGAACLQHYDAKRGFERRQRVLFVEPVITMFWSRVAAACSYIPVFNPAANSSEI